MYRESNLQQYKRHGTAIRQSRCEVGVTTSVDHFKLTRQVAPRYMFLNVFLQILGFSQNFIQVHLAATWYAC